MVMNIVKGYCDLLYDMSDLLVGKRIVIELSHLHHPVEIHIQQLKYHVKHVVMSKDLAARNYVRMLEAYHCLNFCISHGCFPRSELLLKCFYCILCLVLRVKYLINYTEGTFAQNLKYFESLCHDRSDS